MYCLKINLFYGVIVTYTIYKSDLVFSLKYKMYLIIIKLSNIYLFMQIMNWKLPPNIWILDHNQNNKVKYNVVMENHLNMEILQYFVWFKHMITRMTTSLKVSSKILKSNKRTFCNMRNRSLFFTNLIHFICKMLLY